MSNVLITGITGMVGSHLTDFLLKNTDWEIYGMARWRSPIDNIEHLINNINNKSRLHLVYGDLNDESSLANIFKHHKFDYIFHLAAQSFPQTSFSMPINTLETNVIGTYKLLDKINEYSHEARVHVCSSSEVFGKVAREFTPIKEETNFHPASPYAISKVGTDLIGQYFAEAHDLHTITTRMFTHTGPRRGDVFAESTFAKQIAMIEAGYLEPIVKVGNLDSLRTFADVRDAVRAYYVCVTKDLPPGSVYNIGGNFTCTIGALLNKLLSISTAKKVKVEVDPTRLRPIDADLQIPDTSKFKLDTGWQPEISFDETMEDLLNYWRTKVKNGPMLQR